jgi:signal transduction histidine kinase
VDNHPPETMQVVARLLRHEVGDLLQAVYATVAILLDRLATSAAPERQLLDHLRHRAELCRFELDAVVDLVSPGAGVVQRVEIDRLVTASLAHVVPRFSHLSFEEPQGSALPIRADGRLVAGAVTFLLLAVCQHARRRVVVRLEEADGLARVRIRRDGAGVSDEQQRWVEQPFITTKQPMFGLALAVTGRALEPGGGRVVVSNQPEGVEVLLESPIIPRSEA